MFRQIAFGFASLLVLSASHAAAADRDPLPQAQIDKAIAELDAEAKQTIADNRVPGMAIAVVLGDKVIFASGYGLRDTGKAEPVDADTVFQLASVSKSVGSTVISGLIGDGLLTWDTRISDLSPQFSLYEPWVTNQITIRDLYSHRSGLPEHAGDLLEDIGYNREEVLYRLRFQPPATSFRSAYAYTNFGMTAAAVAAATVSGEDWETISEKRLYEPLGMDSTSSRYADFMAQPNHALGHVLVDGKWVFVEQRQPDAQSPAGGVSSSVNDLGKWVIMLVNDGMYDGEQVIAAEPLDEAHLGQMITGMTLEGLPSYYGLGWNVTYTGDGRHRISHSGAFAMGTGTTVNISLDDKLGIIVLTNGSPTGEAEGLAAEFMDRAIYGDVRQQWLDLYRGIFAQMVAAEGSKTFGGGAPIDAAPAQPNASYIGSYSNDYYGVVDVVADGEGLALLLGPKKMKFPLTHFSRDTFTYQTVGENASGPSGVSFSLDGAGTARTVWLEALDNTGLGTFKRAE